ncbi:MAG: iron-sulfur cluster assembly scaffold protein [Planctomycetota bacterium]
MARMAEYSEKVFDHLNHPRHSGLLTEAGLDPATEKLFSADAGPTPRGDRLTLTVKLRTADERILDAGFQATGRMPIPSASCFCEMILGKTLDEALQITVQDLNQALGGLPEVRHRQPVLVVETLDTIARRLRGLPPRARPQPGEAPICVCYHVPEAEIERAIRQQGLKTVEEVTAATQAGNGCGTCHQDIEEIIARCERGEYKYPV